MLAKRFTFRREQGAVGNADHATVQAAHPPIDGSTPPAGRADLPVPASQRSSGLSRLLPGKLNSRRPSPTTNQAITNSNTRDDPLGLRVVHRPEGDHVADIVFVHGLGGGSQRTWSKDRDPALFWPGKFLPAESVISGARISTFGYNSNFRPGSKTNEMSILDFSQSLLRSLKFAKDEFAGQEEELGMGKRPIIFVAHSMGGLVVKEAYLQGQHDPMFKSIIGSVSAILFLSTPHRGTNLAETLNSILQVTVATSPRQFIAELVVSSQILEKINEEFRHVAPKIDLFSFYETRPTILFGRTQVMVLEKNSSVLGYPGEISIPLDGDHHDVCKFESRRDPSYISVRNALKSLIRKVEPRGS